MTAFNAAVLETAEPAFNTWLAGFADDDIVGISFVGSECILARFIRAQWGTPVCVAGHWAYEEETNTAWYLPPWAFTVEDKFDEATTRLGVPVSAGEFRRAVEQ